ncbi:MAG: isoprenylcysteine carboxylmethyltransferase family protein [Terracidiphilus sp.]
MGATRLEFRLRVVILAALVTLGFFSPWIESLGIGVRVPMLVWLASVLDHDVGIPFAVAAPLVLVLGALLAALAALLRVWATAWLGPAVVNHGEMQSGAITAEGPYRFLRNPLYLGSWLMFAAISLLMPVSGCIVSMALLTVFLFRLILGEEAFLVSAHGAQYRDYMAATPRLIPRLFAPRRPASHQPQWRRAVLAELNPIGIFCVFAFLSWSCNNWLMIQGVLVSLGVSLVARALLPVRETARESSE